MTFSSNNTEFDYKKATLIIMALDNVLLCLAYAVQSVANKLIMLIFIMLSVIMLSVIMLSVIKLNVIITNVIMASIVVPIAECCIAECHFVECRGAFLNILPVWQMGLCLLLLVEQTIFPLCFHSGKGL